MKTQDEIVDRVHEIDFDSLKKDPFTSISNSFEREVLIPYLDYEHAREFLKDDTTAADWDDCSPGLDHDVVVEDMLDYLSFALDKAYNHRGLSAERSTIKLSAWLWLLDSPSLGDFRAAKYKNYGVPKLMIIKEAYDVGIDDHMRPFLERMAKGFKCMDGCNDGCSN
jgi:hypothetical protein